MLANAPMLKGIRIVDLTSVVFGPYATQILADLGADVVKVEPPTGDMFRHTGKPARTRGMGPGHMALNRGKRSAALDLKAAEDLAAMCALLAGADVFIHNVRADAIARLGLDYASVKALKPDIVYVHCVGFGSDGAYTGLQAYDDVIQAASGATTLFTRVDGDPRPRYFPSLIADKIAGLHAAYATLGAIVHRLRTGEGQFVEVPMLESFTSFIMKEHLAGLTFDPPNAPACYPRQIDPDRQPFPTADGYISIVPYTDASWGTLFAALGAPELMDDPRFATPPDRFRHLADLYRAVAERTPQRTTAEWIALLHDADIPAMAVRDIGAMLDDPHLCGTGFFTRREHPSEGAYIEMAQPVRFSAFDTREPTHPPLIGEHTEDVRRALQPAQKAVES
jgi:crotonobetainyl-CoA:carnitine CoA-transferase CaiB-like acyl-CoA transferase